MRSQDPWPFIGLLVVLALIWAALAVVVNAVIVTVTAPWFLPVVATVAVVVVIGLVAYLWSRFQA